MNILFIGDVVGSPGREIIAKHLPGLKDEYKLEFVIANAENASGGSGITAKVASELFSCGVDVLTSGDHIWKKQEIFELIEREPRILRPANYPAGAPGKGGAVFFSKANKKVGVVNVNGRVFMEALDCPFKTVKKEIEAIKRETNVIIVDIHAEATSEKVAMGWYLDGDVSAVIGTHTHIQTADERILPRGSAYLTEVGMAGPYDSVIGRRIEDVLPRFLSAIPRRFEVADQNVQLHAVFLDIDDKTGKARAIKRIQRK